MDNQFFRTIPHILTYHNFKITDSASGNVELKEYSNSTKSSCSILKSGSDLSMLNSMPELAVVHGLDLQRQWYLYENIRQHCKSNLAADMTCPKPALPKQPSAAIFKQPSSKPSSSRQPSTTEVHSEGSQQLKKIRACSVCHKEGHTKRRCPDKDSSLA